MSRGRKTFLHCGLRVRSEIELHLPVGAGIDADIEVRCEPARSDSRRYPSGEVIGEYFEAGRRLYTAVEDATGVTIRFPECGEFAIAPDASTIVVRRDPVGPHSDLMPVLLAGTVLAIVHGLLGHTMLHASAVEVDGEALAIAGRSGQGKSTLAALLCGAGARLVSDDVLSIHAEPRPSCIGGAAELRLRPAAAELASSRPEFQSRTTEDRRTAVDPGPATTEALPLGAVVIPIPSREVSEIELVEIRPMDRFLVLLAFPRIAGWRRADVLARQFETLGEVAKRVPVYRATIPWGPPFDPRVVTALLGLLGRPTVG